MKTTTSKKTPGRRRAARQSRKQATVVRKTAKAPVEQSAPAAVKVTKKEAVLALLRREQGATLAELMSATGWQAHSVRGFISGTVRKGLRLRVQRVAREDGALAYHVVGA